MLKSDVSSADDIVVNRRKKYKYDSLSPDVKHSKKRQKKTEIFNPKSCPPRYIITDDVQKIIHFLIKYLYLIDNIIINLMHGISMYHVVYYLNYLFFYNILFKNSKYLI